jgi:regulatory protein
MAVITRLVASNERIKKVKVYLDGKYAFSLEADVALEARLRIDQELSRSIIDKLEHENRLKKALSMANRLLSFRPRSENEIRQKLKRKGLDEPIVNECLAYLKQHGLVDDLAFARYWAENRTTFSPRSQRMVQLELKQKGVTADLADEASGEVDDDISAYMAGAKRASRLCVSDYEEFRRRLGDYLRRRGFGYDVISRSVKKLWDESAHKEENSF